jgi:hypothetical protein
MKTLIMYTFLTCIGLHQAFAANTKPRLKENRGQFLNLKKVPGIKKEEPCFVTVTVPRTGTSMDNCGNYHFINVTGSCTGYNENCDLAFFEARLCARNKANEEYNTQLLKIRQIQCKVSFISAE